MAETEDIEKEIEAKEPGRMAGGGSLPLEYAVTPSEEIEIETVDTTAPVVQLAEADLPTHHGLFRISVFRAGNLDSEIPVLSYGDSGDVPLVRLHSECLTGDAFGSLRCDCGEQLDASLARIAESGYGALLYLSQEGRGIGLANKVRAYALQDGGLDTVDANVALGLPIDGRDYAAGAAVLAAIGLRRIRLLTNNPGKQAALERFGLDVVERVPLLIPSNPLNETYLLTKASRMGHLLAPLGLDEQSEPEETP